MIYTKLSSGLHKLGVISCVAGAQGKARIRPPAPLVFVGQAMAYNVTDVCEVVAKLNFILKPINNFNYENNRRN